MSEYSGFSRDTVRRANMMMMLGIKPERRISDKFSDEDIERALREAAIRVGPFDPEKTARRLLEEEYEEKLFEARRQIEDEYNRKLCEIQRPSVKSFFYGVLQHLTALFLLTLSGYIILKMSGSWDILLNNLFR